MSSDQDKVMGKKLTFFSWMQTPQTNGILIPGEISHCIIASYIIRQLILYLIHQDFNNLTVCYFSRWCVA